MKSIACHIYHTFLKIPQIIFCILPLFDFPRRIWLSLGIQKLVSHFRRLPEKALGLFMLRRDEVFVSFFTASKVLEIYNQASQMWNHRHHYIISALHFFKIKLHYLTSHFANIYQLFAATTNNARSLIQLIISDWK